MCWTNFLCCPCVVLYLPHICELLILCIIFQSVNQLISLTIKGPENVFLRLKDDLSLFDLAKVFMLITMLCSHISLMSG